MEKHNFCKWNLSLSWRTFADHRITRQHNRVMRVSPQNHMLPLLLSPTVSIIAPPVAPIEKAAPACAQKRLSRYWLRQPVATPGRKNCQGLSVTGLFSPVLSFQPKTAWAERSSNGQK
jgi:hypothetical protein